MSRAHTPGHPFSESLLLGLPLALAGGYLDAYTYLLRGGVFANAQTGNLVLLGVRLAQGDFARMGYALVPVLAFCAGVWVTELTKKRFQNPRLHWRSLIVAAELLLLLLIGLLPSSVPDSVINTTVSFVCAVQVCSFKLLQGRPYATTMCTGNLRSAMEHLFLRVVHGDVEAGRACGRYFAVILAFCAGAAGGTWLCGLLGNPAVWAACLPLGAALVLLQRQKGPPSVSQE